MSCVAPVQVLGGRLQVGHAASLKSEGPSRGSLSPPGTGLPSSSKAWAEVIERHESFRIWLGV